MYLYKLSENDVLSLKWTFVKKLLGSKDLGFMYLKS